MDAPEIPPSGTAAVCDVPAPPPLVTMPVIDEAELARLALEARQAAEAEGRRDGWTQGHAEGYAAGFSAGQVVAQEQVDDLRALTQSLPGAMRRAEAEIADAVLALAMDVARQVVHRTLTAAPDWILALVQDLLRAEPALHGDPRLLLHPDDVALVKGRLGDELQAAGWLVCADDTLTRGGCRVQSACGEMDATLESRWERVTAVLGQPGCALKA